MDASVWLSELSMDVKHCWAQATHTTSTDETRATPFQPIFQCVCFFSGKDIYYYAELGPFFQPDYVLMRHKIQAHPLFFLI